MLFKKMRNSLIRKKYFKREKKYSYQKKDFLFRNLFI